MTPNETINDAKRRFLDRYNCDRDVNVALSRAISAAVQHNALYRTQVDQNERVEIRGVWAANLQQIAVHFVNAPAGSTAPVFSWEPPDTRNVPEFDKTIVEDHPAAPSEEATTQYNELIIGLMSAMNDSFGSKFRDAGFRISHSQKSISVFLKHLWCMQRIRMPLQCPIDRKILSCLRTSNYNPWTKIDTLEEHTSIIAALNTIAGSTPLAVWELLNFLPGG